MMDVRKPALGAHGAARLPAVDVESYNIELRDNDGFLGDRASKAAYQAIIDIWRKAVKEAGRDPFGNKDTADLSRRELDQILEGDDLLAAGVVLSSIEDYAQELTTIVRRMMRTKEWRDIECIVMGGGMRERRVGELAIGRAGVLLRSHGVDIDLVPIRNHPDDAGLIGAVQLAPTWIFEAHDSILAVDIGGTNIRAGIVKLNLKKATDLSRAAVFKRQQWRHADDDPKREEAVQELVEMLEKLIRQARRAELKLAPFIGLGCPGRIEPDGSIDRGAQNLPGNWESERFNLPSRLLEAVPRIGGHDTVVVMHNDAVVQGLSEAPFMTKVKRWGALTMGTGLGNAAFLNREPEARGKPSK